MLKALAILICITTLSACGHVKEMPRYDDNNLKPKPGLFSGPDGEFTINKALKTSRGLNF